MKQAAATQGLVCRLRKLDANDGNSVDGMESLINLLEDKVLSGRGWGDWKARSRSRFQFRRGSCVISHLADCCCGR